MDIIDMSDSSLEELRGKINDNEKLVLIDFYAFWCEPCIMLNPIVARIADEYKDNVEVYKVEVYKVDVDKNPDVADKYNITNIPTLVVQKQDEIKENIIGYRSYEDLQKTLKDSIE